MYRWQCWQNSCSTLSVLMNPFSYRLQKMSWATLTFINKHWLVNWTRWFIQNAVESLTVQRWLKTIVITNKNTANYLEDPWNNLVYWTIELVINSLEVIALNSSRLDRAWLTGADSIIACTITRNVLHFTHTKQPTSEQIFFLEIWHQYLVWCSVVVRPK